jgi:hypothetical protein
MAGEKAEAIKAEVIAGKNKIVPVAEEKFESVKKEIHDYTAPARKKKIQQKSCDEKSSKKSG